MTKQEAREKFIKRLDSDYLTEFKNNTLFKEGNTLYWENLNSVYEITVISFDGINVKFKYQPDDKIEEFSIDNLMVYNKKHLKELYDRYELYDSESVSIVDLINMNEEAVYIIHNKESDDNSGYYVGQAMHSGWRLKDHLQNAKAMATNSKDKIEEIDSIDTMISKGMKYTIKFIPLAESGYSNLDALEACFIAYFNSFYARGGTGYNRTHGNNGPGNQRKTVIEIE